MKKRKLITPILVTTSLAVASCCSVVGCAQPQSTFTVTFETFGGTKIAPQVVHAGERVSPPNIPTKDGFIFENWFSNSEFEGERFNFAKPITSNITLYALWSVKGLHFKINEDGDGYVVSGARDEFYLKGDIELPSTFNDGTHGTLPVKEIGRDAFWCNTEITSVKIPDSIAKISEGAFDRCEGLTSIHIPASVVNIEPTALMGCSGLEHMTVDPNNKAFTSRNAGGAEVDAIIKKGGTMIPTTLLYGCKNSTIPKEVRIVESNAFYRSPIDDVEFEENSQVQIIGHQAFNKCPNIESINIPDSVETIEGGAFGECPKLKNVNFGENSKLDFLSNDAFLDCVSIETISLPKSLRYIGYYSFSGCTGLKTINFPEGSMLDIIRTYAFENCTSLQSINIPDSTTIIDNEAFLNCENLQSIHIGKNVNEIANDAFLGCSSLNTITVDDANAIFTSKGEVDGAVKECNAIISKDTYPVLCHGSRGTTIPNNVVIIGDNAFNSVANLGDIQIPSSVTNIESMAFAGCAGLTNVTFPTDSALKTIWNGAFSYCNDLTEITIPKTVTSFGLDVFRDCEQLKTVAFEEGSQLHTIEDYDFEGCFRLETINFPNNLTKIGNGAFEGCINLQKLFIPATVDTIGDSAFALCNKLTEIKVDENNTTFTSKGTIDGALAETNSIIKISGNTLIVGCPVTQMPQNISAIGSFAFTDCNIKTVAIPPLVTRIGYRAFAGCANLESVDFSNATRLKLIELQSFAGCQKLESIAIPDSVDEIGSSAFYDCSKLHTVTINKSSRLTTFGGGVFENCTSLKAIFIPAKVAEFGNWPICGCPSLEKIEVDPNNMTYTSQDSEGNECKALIKKSSRTLISGCKNTTIPDTIEIIERQAFYGSDLEEIEIPDSVQSIGNWAFGKTKLSKIYIPKKVIDMGTAAFGQCDNLTEMKVDPSNNRLTSRDPDGNECNLIVSKSSYAERGITLLSACQSTTTIPSNVNAIWEWAFVGCKGLTDIVFSDSMQWIGVSAFDGCVNLRNITFSQLSGEIVESFAFVNCQNLTLIIDSPQMANKVFDTPYLFVNTDVIYLNQNIGQLLSSSYISLNFVKQSESDKPGYDKYLPKTTI